jgi:hypothetical protein
VSGTVSRLGLLLGLAASAACMEREITATPFHIEATLDGAPLAPGLTEFLGVAALVGERSLRVTSPDGPVLALAFSDAGGADVRFPADLEGRELGVRLIVDVAHRGPHGEPLPIPALQVIAKNDAGFFEYRVVLGEGTYVSGNGLPALPLLFLPPTLEDFPRLTVFADSLYFEPASCGLVYYDQLRVLSGQLQDLEHATTKRIALGQPPEWNVRHVLSWHRIGDCPDDVSTWTQAAMWR